MNKTFLKYREMMSLVAVFITVAMEGYIHSQSGFGDALALYDISLVLFFFNNLRKKMRVKMENELKNKK